MTRGASVVLITAAMITACQDPSSNPTTEQGSLVERHISLRDVTVEAGVDFTHFNGMTGETYFVETVGAGVGLLDADNDGDLDLFVVQGELLQDNNGSKTFSDAIFPPGQTDMRSRLYLNQWVETGALRFVDITDISGLHATGYGMGVATGDFDNDGRMDIYLSNFGDNQLWRNCSTETGVCFEDVTEAANVNDSRWSTSASFADVNADGWLDLYVANYVDFIVATHKVCTTASGQPNYCGPQSYNGQEDSIFIGSAQGQFTKAEDSQGFVNSASSGLGVVAADFDLDSQIDWYVANDLRRNHLWMNTSDERGLQFTNSALLSGSAVGMDGRPQASMGVIAGDFDNDGDEDLFMTHLSGDFNTQYLNSGGGQFMDRSSDSGMAAPSIFATGFGTVHLDLENDGWLDIVAVNGEVRLSEDALRSGEPYPLGQVNQLFHNLGDGRYQEIGDQYPEVFHRNEVSRGIAVGDLNNDGREDFVISNNSGPLQIVINETPPINHWIGLRVLYNDRDALGAQINVTMPDGQSRMHRIATDGSYLSANDPRALIGLGNADEVNITVRLPGGHTQVWQNLSADRYHLLTVRPQATSNQGDNG